MEKNKTIIIRKSFDFRNNRWICAHHSNGKKRLLQRKEMKITIKEGETCWFTLRWWSSRKYTYDELDENTCYELHSILGHKLAIAMIVLALLSFIVPRSCLFFQCLPYVFGGIAVYIFVLNIFFCKRMMYLKEVINKL